MESELKPLNPAPIDPQPEPNDRPLLKPDPKPAQPQITVTNQTIEEMEKIYAAYVRNDVYGTMGLGELPWTEKFLLGLGLLFLLPIRVVLATVVLVVYYVICRVCTAFRAPEREDDQEDYSHMGGWRRAVIVQSGRFLSRCMLFVFGFYWISEFMGDEVDGQYNNEATSSDQSDDLLTYGAIISNHRSVGKLPLVGLISKCLGCVYVQRESKASDFKGISGVVNERIREAHQNKFAPKMMLFPEGTTTNGDYLLPFKTGAFLAKAPVLPVLLRYPYQRFSPAWDTISGDAVIVWILFLSFNSGNLTQFLQMRHVILLLCQFVNYIEVTRLPVYHPSEQEKEDPKLYAENVRRLMAHEGNLILSDIGLAEKRVYHAALNGNNIIMPTVLHQKDE